MARETIKRPRNLERKGTGKKIKNTSSPPKRRTTRKSQPDPFRNMTADIQKTLRGESRRGPKEKIAQIILSQYNDPETRESPTPSINEYRDTLRKDVGTTQATPISGHKEVGELTSSEDDEYPISRIPQNGIFVEESSEGEDEPLLARKDEETHIPPTTRTQSVNPTLSPDKQTPENRPKSRPRTAERKLSAGYKKTKRTSSKPKTKKLKINTPPITSDEDSGSDDGGEPNTPIYTPHANENKERCPVDHFRKLASEEIATITTRLSYDEYETYFLRLEEVMYARGVGRKWQYQVLVTLISSELRTAYTTPYTQKLLGAKPTYAGFRDYILSTTKAGDPRNIYINLLEDPPARAWSPDGLYNFITKVLTRYDRACARTTPPHTDLRPKAAKLYLTLLPTDLVKEMERFAITQRIRDDGSGKLFRYLSEYSLQELQAVAHDIEKNSATIVKEKFSDWTYDDPPAKNNAPPPKHREINQKPQQIDQEHIHKTACYVNNTPRDIYPSNASMYNHYEAYFAGRQETPNDDRRRDYLGRQHNMYPGGKVFQQPMEPHPTTLREHNNFPGGPRTPRNNFNTTNLQPVRQFSNQPPRPRIPLPCFYCGELHSYARCLGFKRFLEANPRLRGCCPSCLTVGGCVATCHRKKSLEGKGYIQEIRDGSPIWIRTNDPSRRYTNEIDDSYFASLHALQERDNTRRTFNVNYIGANTKHMQSTCLNEQPIRQEHTNMEARSREAHTTPAIGPNGISQMHSEERHKNVETWTHDGDTGSNQGRQLLSHKDLARTVLHVRRTSNTAKAHVTIDDIPIRAVMDSGADCSLLQAKYVRDPARVTKPKIQHNITGATGNDLIIIGTISAEVCVGPIRATHTFFVIGHLPCEAILGVDFMVEHGMVTRFDEWCLEFPRNDNVRQPLIGRHPAYTHSCILKESIQIKPKETLLVATTFQHRRQSATIKPSQIGYELKGFEDHRHHLIIPQQVTKKWVEITNFGEETLALPTGMVMSDFRTLTQTDEVKTITPANLYANDEGKTSAETRQTAYLVTCGEVPKPRKTPDIPEELIRHKPDISKCKTRLTTEQYDKLDNLIIEYIDIFNDGTMPLSCSKLIQCTIETGDTPPISIPPRRLAPAMRAVAQEMVSKLDDTGVTEPCAGPWSAPIVMVKKKNGTWRMCCDWRELNKSIIVPKHPLPRIDDALAAFEGKKFFTVVDMTCGFNQIEIAEADRPKTGFVTPDCARQYTRMPFGLANAPATFQRMVDILLSGMKWVNAIGYLDDIIIFSANFEQHLIDLRMLFRALRNAPLQLNPEKCDFASNKVSYLGHIISEDGIHANPKATQAIDQFPTPTCWKEAARFLGMTNYYRKFIPNASIICAPLHKIATKDNFKWDDTTQLAFETIKRCLATPPVLAHPDYNKPFIIDCDGSNAGLGAILSQPAKDKDGNEGERPVMYASRSLVTHEKIWTATELEAAAVIWALETFRCFIHGIHVTLRTDHAPLEWLRNKTEKCARLKRWAMRLLDFNFTIEHRAGTRQRHVDALSRAPLPPSAEQEPESLDVFNEYTILHLQMKDNTQYVHLQDSKLGFMKNLTFNIPRGGNHKKTPIRKTNELLECFVTNKHDTAAQEPLIYIEKPLRRERQEESKALTELLNRDEDVVEEDVFIELDDEECPEEEEMIRETQRRVRAFYDDNTTTERTPITTNGTRTDADIRMPDEFTTSTLIKEQKTDELCQQLARVLEQSEEAPMWLTTTNNTVTSVGGLIAVTKNGLGKPRIVLPTELTAHAIQTHHSREYGGHFGVQKTYNRLHTRYFWRGMKRQVHKAVLQCPLCMAYKGKLPNMHWLSLPIGTPFEIVAMDMFGPIQISEEGYQHIIVMIDHHTRWVEIIPAKSATATETAKIFHDTWITRYGVPRVLLTDNGTNFCNAILNNIADTYGIHKITSTRYNPRGNSLVESFMRTLKGTLVTTIRNNPKRWCKALPAAALAYRSTPHSTTGYSPFFLLTGQEVMLPLSREWDEPSMCETGETWLTSLWNARVDIIEAHAKEEIRRREIFTKYAGTLKEGTWVMSKTNRLEDGPLPNKWAPKYKGPYCITGTGVNGLTFEVTCPITEQKQVLNRARLKVIALPNDEFDPTQNIEDLQSHFKGKKK